MAQEMDPCLKHDGTRGQGGVRKAEVVPERDVFGEAWTANLRLESETLSPFFGSYLWVGEEVSEGREGLDAHGWVMEGAEDPGLLLEM